MRVPRFYQYLLIAIMFIIYGCKHTEPLVELEQDLTATGILTSVPDSQEIIPQAIVLTCSFGSSRVCNLTMDEFTKANQLDRIELLELMNLATMEKGGVNFELSVCCQIIDRIHKEMIPDLNVSGKEAKP